MGIEAAIIGSAGLSAASSIFGSSKAAKAQTQAAQMGIDAQLKMFKELQNALAPYMKAGEGALGQIQQNLPFYTSPIEMLDQEGLEALPGYQLTRDQGLKAIQASAAAKGLGNSGTALKGAERFATGLADQTYGQQFDRYFNLEQSNRTRPFNQLMDIVRSGQSAAGALGGAGIQTGQGVSNNLIGAGNAQAGAYMAGANAIGNAGNSIMNYAMMNQYLNPGSGMYGAAPSSYYSMGGTQVPLFG